MAAHQHTQWASGSRKPPPSGRRRKKVTPWTRLKRKTARHLQHHPGQALAVTIALGAIALACLVLGLFAENLLYYLSMSLTALGAVAANRTRYLSEQRQQARPPKVRPERYAPPPPKPQPEQQPSDGPVKCTETGKPIGIEAGENRCTCARQHVATACSGSPACRKCGRCKFGLPLGAPIRRKPRERRPPPTTKR